MEVVKSQNFKVTADYRLQQTRQGHYLLNGHIGGQSVNASINKPRHAFLDPVVGIRTLVAGFLQKPDQTHRQLSAP